MLFSERLPCASARLAPFFLHIAGGTKSRVPRESHAAGFSENAVAGFGALEELPVILVVEDDEQVQTVVEDALIEGGFEPAIAPSGEEAVTLLRGNKGNYRALVADIGLRGRMDGWEVAKRAREIDPEFPIVYMTGIGKDEWGLRAVPNSILMTKPFAPAQLVTALSELLNSGTATTEDLPTSFSAEEAGTARAPLPTTRN